MEFNIETIAMMSALVVMGAAIGAKIITLQLMRVMENAIAEVNQARMEVQRELQRALSKKNVGNREVAKLTRKKQKIRGQIRKLRSELNSFKKSEAERQKQRAAMRGKLD